MTTINFHQCSTIVQHWMECYDIIGELNDDHSLDINILDPKGTCIVEGSGVSNDKFMNLLKIKKVNVGSLENPKFSNIGDY